MSTVICKKGSECVSEIREYATAKMASYKDNEWDYSDNYGFFQRMLERDDYSNYIAFLLDNKVLDVATIDSCMGLTVVYMPYCSQQSILYAMLDALRATIGEDILIHSDSRGMEEYGLFLVNLKSSLSDEDEELTYSIYSDMLPLWVYTPDKVNVLRDAIEAKYLTVDENAEITFATMTGCELQKFLWDDDLMGAPYWRSWNGFSHIIGFHYTELQYGNDTTKYLVAIANGNRLIGCIKYAEYYENHYGLDYIDVARHYRRRGVATRLIEELSKTIGDKYPLVLSSESDMGKKCHIHNHFKKYDWPLGVFVENRKTYKYDQIA